MSASQGSKVFTYFIRRNKNNNLPVYSDFRNANSRRLTVVSKYTGNVQELKTDIQTVLGPQAEITEKVGRLEIKGNYVSSLKEWMTKVGF
ncbi:mitochondrial 54S ribosomal protein IMG2 [Planoprotostelium fungivorum]|uniref:Large ribosomal subunit protein mL49 n=1 Tax=Planoprotostelium fungivorum TaxID=1890364 RepID=A0A2P6MUL8_9EUKA|nr:mitochondrial 54S ribosomal protein IMG2 [Planoprotostelium fungivorum]PRP75393.1 mitochondrial 54S ribosomal protein IMG2 [Planoprotostelium fungivorum]